MLPEPFAVSCEGDATAAAKWQTHSSELLAAGSAGRSAPELDAADGVNSFDRRGRLRLDNVSFLRLPKTYMKNVELESS